LNGADVNVRDRWGNQPLNDARRSLNGAPIVELLLSAGATVDAESKMVAPASELLATPQAHCAGTSVGSSRLLPSSAVVEKMAKMRASFDMLCAVHVNDIDQVLELITAGTDVNAVDYDSRSPLHLAASEGHADIAALLIAHGANLDAEDRWHSTALADAKREGHANVVLAIEMAQAKLRVRSTLS
jgi:Ankyrin repeats (3 copies)